MTSCKHALLLLAFVAPLIITTHAALSVTWNLQGVTQAGASTTSYPGARYGATTWVDSNGKLWMFSGVGKENTTGEGYLNQLYQYNADTNVWVLVYGSVSLNIAGVYPTAAGGSGTPGGRYGSGRWVDASGNLYLFGGQGIGSVAGSEGYLNDFWMYNTVSGTWTFLQGQTTANAAASASNTAYPSPRTGAAHWTDNAGTFYLFGGRGYTSGTATIALLNDLWSYTPSTATWTLITTAAAPAGRAFASAWADADGNGWIYGGSDLAAQYYNDMWKYSAKAWTNVAGSTTPNQRPVYPTTPGGLYAAASFHNSGINYMFGGTGLSAVATAANTANRDLWSFNTKTSAWTYEFGTQGTVVGSQTTPGARYLPALWKDKSGNIIVFGGNGYDSTGLSTPSILGDTRVIKACVFTSSCLVGADNTTANATTSAFSTSNATTTSTSGGSATTGAASTTGGTVTTTTATVNLTLAMSGNPAQVNTSQLGGSVAASLGIDPKYVTTTIVLLRKRDIQANFIVVISVFFPNSSAITAATGGQGAGNLTQQLAVLANNVNATLSSPTVKNTLAAQNVTVTGVTTTTSSQVVVVSTSTATTKQATATTTSAAGALAPAFTPLLQVVVSFAACVFALVVCTN